MSRARAAVVVLALTAAGDARAHHSISAIYDNAQQITVEGLVTEFQFVNPHPILVIDAAAQGGEPELWRLEMDNRVELAGIGIDARTFKPGDRVVARGSAAREAQQSLYLYRLERPADGLLYEQIGSRPRINL